MFKKYVQHVTIVSFNCKCIALTKYAYSSLMVKIVIHCYSHSISQDEEVLQLIALTILSYKITLNLQCIDYNDCICLPQAAVAIEGSHRYCKQQWEWMLQIMVTGSHNDCERDGV